MVGNLRAGGGLLRAVRPLLWIVLAGLLAGGCVKFVKFEYDLPLQSAYRADTALERTNGEGGADGGQFVVEDASIRIAWHADMQRLHFRLHNRTEGNLRILWAEAVYVREDGLSGPVAHRSHGGGFHVTRATEPVTVPPGGTVEDFVAPAAHYEVGFLRPLFKLDRSSRESAEKEIPNLKGKQVRVVLPLEINGAKTPYSFTFRIRDIHIIE